jgi:hypothetical protein
MEYIRVVFLPHLANARRDSALAQEEAVLLMDHCGPHIAQAVLDLLTQAHCLVLHFAPHTTKIFQVLDLTLFGVLKRQCQYQITFETEHRTADFIFKVYKGFRSTIIDAISGKHFEELVSLVMSSIMSNEFNSAR